MAKCLNCGADVQDAAKFCTECGAEMAEPFTPEVQASVNPFESFDNNVPKPEVASELVFEEPDWSEKTGYGKPGFDPNKPAQDAEVQDAPPAQDAGFEPNQNAWDQSQQQMPQGNPEFFNQNWYQDSPQPVGRDKVMSIISYIFLICWIIAFAVRDGATLSEFRKHHLNQSLILHITSAIATWIGGIAGAVLGLLALVLAIMGMISASRNSTAPLPVIGSIKIFK